MSPRVMPENRIPDIIRAAASVFGRKGYRLAQMEEIARMADVSKATLYYYFESKIHLFYYVLENGVPAEGESVPPPEATSPKNESELLKLIELKLKERSRLSYLEGLLDNEPEKVDMAAEIEGILRELWELFEQNRVQIVVLEKSALEFPELAQVYDKYARSRVLHQLERYLESRIRLGAVRPLNSPLTIARLIIESMAWFGFKQLGDYFSPVRYPKSEALPELISMFLNGLSRDGRE